MMTDKVGGYYTVGKVKNDVVVKSVKCKSLEEEMILYQVFEWSKESAEKYYNILKKANIRISKLKILQEGQKLYLEQNWVKGENLTCWISNNYGSQYEDMIKIFEELLNYQWKIYEQERTARIDFNLKNFIVVDNQPILIDFVPPIFIDGYKVEKYKTYSLKIGELLELYYKIDWQMVAIVGYWLQEIIYSPLFEQWKEHRKYINKLLSVLFQRCNSMLARYDFRIQLGRKYIEKNKNVIFHKKIEIIYKFVDEIYGLEETRNIMKHLPRDYENTV